MLSTGNPDIRVRNERCRALWTAAWGRVSADLRRWFFFRILGKRTFPPASCSWHHGKIRRSPFQSWIIHTCVIFSVYVKSVTLYQSENATPNTWGLTSVLSWDVAVLERLWLLSVSRLWLPEWIRRQGNSDVLACLGTISPRPADNFDHPLWYHTLSLGKLMVKTHHRDIDCLPRTSSPSVM